MYTCVLSCKDAAIENLSFQRIKWLARSQNNVSDMNNLVSVSQHYKNSN